MEHPVEPSAEHPMESSAIATAPPAVTPGTPGPTGRGRRTALVAVLGAASLIGLTVGASVVAGASPAPASARAGAGGEVGVLVVGAPVAGGSPADFAKIEAAFTKYTACMRDHGIDMPEPVKIEGSATFEEGGPIVGVAPQAGALAAPPALSFDPASKEFAAADEACKPILEEAGMISGTISSASVDGSVQGSAAAGAAGLVVVGGPGEGGVPADFEKIEAAFTKYTACMRDHGIDMPDPVRIDGSATLEDGAAITVTPPSGAALALSFDPAGEEFAAADAACSPILQEAGMVSGSITPAIPVSPPGAATGGE